MEGQDMTDYSELVEALRNCSGQGFLTCRGCQYNNNMLSCAYKMMRDAAAAIEALLPKRGKWIYSKERMRPDMCSVCGCIYEADRFMDKIAWNYCPNCGAKMTEVQE